MRIDRAWQAWDNWCTATRYARWRTSKHANIPDRDRQVVADLERALTVGAARLGATSLELRKQITEERRAGWTVLEAVSRTVEHLLGRQTRGDPSCASSSAEPSGP